MTTGYIRWPCLGLTRRRPISPAVSLAEVPGHELFGYMGPSRPRRLLVVGPLDQELQLVLFRGDTVVENLLDGVL